MSDERYWPRPSVQAFAEQMERKLSKNDEKKGGWEACEIGWLLRRAGQELDELRRAVRWKAEPAAIAAEAADVANFLMMLAENYEQAWEDDLDTRDESKAARR